MVSPILNEEMLLATLSLPMRADQGEYLRNGSAYALLDAHDRKVTREFYVDVLSRSYLLNEQMRRVEVMTRILHELQDTPPAELSAKISERITQALSQAEQARTDLVGMVKKIIECPMDDSIIN